MAELDDKKFQDDKESYRKTLEYKRNCQTYCLYGIVIILLLYMVAFMICLLMIASDWNNVITTKDAHAFLAKNVGVLSLVVTISLFASMLSIRFERRRTEECLEKLSRCIATSEIDECVNRPVLPLIFLK